MIRRFSVGLMILTVAGPALAEVPATAEKPEQNSEVIRLFDGKTLNGWTTLDGRSVTKGWTVKDGLLCRESRGGHLLSEQQFGDFELEFEWKIAKRGNSGVKYRLKKFGKHWLGCEYQLYDDRGRAESASSTGALYALYPPIEDKPINPPGEFNSSRIVVRGSRVEHWINGRKIVEAEIGSDDWNRRVARSKFDKYPGFAQTDRSPIMLQDHGSEICFRKITIHPLDR